jgi:aminoglycoside phosphotransferase (APT) family kinase protein
MADQRYASESEYQIDEWKVDEWMRANVKDYRGPLRVERFPAGQSNPTYKLSTEESTYVLRRQPAGVLMKGAHAIDREVRVQSALEAVDFPVPHVRAYCSDDEVIGTRFYIMDWVEGRIFWDACLPSVDLESRRDYFLEMSRTLARLHCVDYCSIGLQSFGRPGNYVARQIARWSGQYEDDTAHAGRSPDMERTAVWLRNHIPDEDTTCVVHGDFRIDNVMFDSHAPKIVSVLDWELSTLGHPLADLANFLMMFRLPPRVVVGLAGISLAELNIPTELECLDAYCNESRRSDFCGIDYYLAFAMFRLAAIFHGIKARIAKGSASSQRALEYAAGTDWMAAMAWQQTGVRTAARRGVAI